mmetsp:Transcript_58142/g.124904  ORF Transcript_58142/g.124904 Transcript_58142/m.124904 type:complete len:342 (-) Transcript_58142:266-1291(-)
MMKKDDGRDSCGSMRFDDAGQPADLDTLYRTCPSLMWGPLVLTGLVWAMCQVDPVASRIQRLGMTPYGFSDSLALTVYAIVMSYAAHGWFCARVSQERQLQTYEPKGSSIPAGASRMAYVNKKRPEAASARTVAILLSSMAYSVFPFAPSTWNFAVFFAWSFVVSVYWDLQFFVIHKLCHEHRWLYKFVHKLHHTDKTPGPFTAYFVTYQSHFCLEQSIFLIFGLLGMPRNVFTFTIFRDTIITFVEHCGHDVASVKLPLVPLTFGQLSTVLSPWSPFLGGATTAEHDWHHEKLVANYALSFQYLDKLFGSFHPGRNGGEAIKTTEKVCDKQPVDSTLHGS